MHSGSIATSPRLRLTLYALQGAGERGLTTLALCNVTGSMAAHSDVAALRANGISVACRYEGRAESGAKVYRYTIGGAEAA